MILLHLFFVFMKIGIFTFGSGYAMLALAEKELVQTHNWLTPEQFSDAVALSEVTPGPIMVNMAAFVGVKQQGTLGAITATLGLILPPMVFIVLITRFYIGYRDHEAVQRVFKGLRPAIVGLVVTVVVKLWGTNIVDIKSVLISLLVVAVVLAGLHPILAVIGGGALGLLLWR